MKEFNAEDRSCDEVQINQHQNQQNQHQNRQNQHQNQQNQNQNQNQLPMVNRLKEMAQ